MPKLNAVAWADCFVAAPDATTAASRVVDRFLPKGYLIEDCDPIQELDPASWSAFVRDRYPSTFAQLPSESDVLKLVEDGGVLLAPFSEWKREA